VPTGAEIVAENETVTVHVGVHGLLVKIGVIPSGSDEVVTKKPTGSGVPLTRVAVIEDVSLVEPCVTVRLFGEGVERLKSNATSMVRVMLAVFVTPPPTA